MDEILDWQLGHSTVKSPKSCRSAISELYSKRFSVESPHDGHTIVV